MHFQFPSKNFRNLKYCSNSNIFVIFEISKYMEFQKFQKFSKTNWNFLKFQTFWRINLFFEYLRKVIRIIRNSKSFLVIRNSLFV